jgi:2-polyprenyl-3-methyl-5-hydroxy-6-metoxy-1,4-benzoquinol methylase
METIETCPICNGSQFQEFLTCEDWLITHEHFHLKKCDSCSFVITNPRPDQPSLNRYYQSEQYISHNQKSHGPVASLYFLARKFTLRWKIGLLKQHNSKGSLLDFGCGTGEFLRAAHQQGWHIDGLEPNDAARQRAAQITGINIASNLEQLNHKQYDVITLWHVLEHIPDLQQTLLRLHSLMKRDGVMLIAVPNHESYDACTYKNYWAAYDVPRHLWHFSKSTMNRLLCLAGLKVKSTLPMKLDAYYISLLSEKYKSGKPLSLLTFLRATVQGYISNRKANSAQNYSSLIYIATQ